MEEEGRLAQQSWDAPHSDIQTAPILLPLRRVTSYRGLSSTHLYTIPYAAYPTPVRAGRHQPYGYQAPTTPGDFCIH